MVVIIRRKEERKWGFTRIFQYSGAFDRLFYGSWGKTDFDRHFQQKEGPMRDCLVCIGQNHKTTTETLLLLSLHLTYVTDCTSPCDGSCNHVTGCDKCQAGKKLPVCKQGKDTVVFIHSFYDSIIVVILPS